MVDIPRATPLKTIDSPAPRNKQMPISLQLEWRICAHLPSSTLGICLPWVCVCVVHTVPISAYVPLPWVSGKYLPSSHSSHLALKIHLPPLLHKLLNFQNIYRHPIYLGLSIPMFITLYELIIVIPQKGRDKRPP